MHPVAVIALLAIVLTAWLFRRAPCSWLCPLGAVSEYLGKLGKRVFGRHLSVPKWLDHALLTVKYLMTFAILFFVALTPVQAIRGFLSTPFYAVADMQMFDVYARFGVAILIGLGLVVVLSLVVKSAWCRYLCPYGALQGIFGLLSPVVLAKDDATCTGCGRCNRACPNGVDVAHASGGVVTSAECMGCTSCVEACPKQDTLRFRLANRITIDPMVFGVWFVMVFGAIVAVAGITGHLGGGLAPTVYRQVVHMSGDVKLPG
jgi:polyferredoxin